MKKAISLLLASVLVLCMVPSALAANATATVAAEGLNKLGLFSGTGTKADGTPNYDLDRAPTRQEAITMLVKLVGGTEEAGKGGWSIPFTDVDDWAKNWVGYAYAKGLTVGISETKLGANNKTTVAQYLTFVLKALGYDANSDFSWNDAWKLSDQIGLTDGRYNGSSAFTRGDMAIISYSALTTKLKGRDCTLAEELNLTIEADTPDDFADCYSGTEIKTVTAVTGAKCTKSTRLFDSDGKLMFPQSVNGYVPGYDLYTYYFDANYQPFALDEYKKHFLPYVEYLDLLGFDHIQRPTITGGFMTETYKYKLPDGRQLTVKWSFASGIDKNGNDMTITFD